DLRLPPELRARFRVVRIANARLRRVGLHDLDLAAEQPRARLDDLAERDGTIAAEVEDLEARTATAREDARRDVVHVDESARRCRRATRNLVLRAHAVEQALDRRPVRRTRAIDDAETEHRDVRTSAGEPEQLFRHELADGVLRFHRRQIDRAIFELDFVVP